MDTQRRYLEIEPGVDLYVEETGQGRPLVFIPGWSMTTEVFARQVPHFADRYRIITYDPRCQGRSSATVTGLSHPHQGRDLARLLELLDADDAVLLPWSNACLGVWEMFRNQGIDGTAGAVFIDLAPKALGDPASDWCEGGAEDQTGFQSALADDHRAATRAFCASMWQGTPPAEELDWVADQSMKMPLCAALVMAADGLARDETEIAGSSAAAMPTLHVVHEEKAAAAARWRDRHCPSARVEGLGFHFMFWEYADRFNALVDGFLAEHGL